MPNLNHLMIFRMELDCSPHGRICQMFCWMLFKTVHSLARRSFRQCNFYVGVYAKATARRGSVERIIASSHVDMHSLYHHVSSCGQNSLVLENRGKGQRENLLRACRVVDAMLDVYKCLGQKWSQQMLIGVFPSTRGVENGWALHNPQSNLHK